MRCPFCGNEEDKVIDSRTSKDGREIRRRRECDGCNRRFTTYERVEESMPQVVKRDGRREPFDRYKIERGITAAGAKRPVTVEQIKQLAEDVEREVSELGISEIASRDVGERVLLRLRGIDQVAYVRFASIYREFDDLDAFAKEVDLLREDGGVEGTDPSSPSARRRAGTDTDGMVIGDLTMTHASGPNARRHRDTEAIEVVPDPTVETQAVGDDDDEPSARR
jgi:transcriptional repressor NrdR